MAQLAYRLFDADDPDDETRDCFTRHMPKRLLDRAIRVTPDAAGRERSDFPHPEGLTEPAEFADEIAALPEAEQRLILCDNAMRRVGRA